MTQNILEIPKTIMTQNIEIVLEQQRKRQYKVMMEQIGKRKKTTTTTIPIITTHTTTTLTIPCLPDEIIFFHILPKLPVKSLLRFNCVSKLWYKTIQDPNFHASHLNHSKSKPSLFAVFHDRYKLRFLHLEGEGYHNNAKAYSSVDLMNDACKFIIGSCNGLTCTVASHHIDIINPSTREVLEIPFPGVQVSLRPGLVYYGFGFDPLMNEYKLIHFRLYGLGCGECVIYTLGTHTWRNITATSHYPQSYFPFDVAPLCSSGVLFWMTVGHNILSFDVHNEIFQVIPCPHHATHDLIRHSLFELRGCPCLVYVYDKLVDGLELRLYTLTGHHLPMHTKQHQSSNWIKEKFIVRLPFKPDASFIRVVTFSEHIFLQYTTNDGKFILCNANKGKSYQKSSGLCGSYCRPQDVILVNHVENLMSLKTLVPSGATKVKYVSSSEAVHESPTTPCSKHQREKRERDRRRLLNNEGFLNFNCWFSSI